MTSKKEFYNDNPAEAFFMSNNEPKQKNQPVKKEAQPVREIQPGTGGFQRKEKKSVRLNLLITPSVKEKLRRESERTGISINDLINQVLNKYFN